MHTLTYKVVAFLLALSVLAGSLSLIAPSYPASALVPTAETISLPTVLFQGVLKAVEAGGYVILRKYIRQGVQNLVKDAANTLFRGGRGKGPAYETKPWDNFWEEAGNEAIGAAIEGFAQGMVNEYERQKKKEGVYNNLKEVDAKRQNLDLQSTDLENKLSQCHSEAATVYSDGQPGRDPKECDALYAQYDAKIKEASDFANTNAGKFKAFGITGDYAQGISERYAELNSTRDAEVTACAGDRNSDACKTAHQATIDKVREIELVKQEADAAFAQADPESADAIKAIDQEHKDKEGALVTGQVGALTEVGRTIVDIVCKPEADLALNIFLGLGESIAQPRRKPICPLNVLKENWSRVITDAGVDPSGFLSERTLKAWNDLGVLVDPSRSDVGAAWRITIGGHSAQELARQLGVTDYTAIAAMGGIKPITDIAKNTITTPARALGQSIDKSIGGQYDQLTNFVPVGHLVADILITTASAFLDTTLDLIKDGLRKPQVVRRNPRTNQGLAALGRYTTGGNPLYFPNADPNTGTEAFAEATLAVFDELKYTGEQSWDVLNKITIPSGSNPLCYDPRPQADEAHKAVDPESCAIDQDFQSAIEQGLTVQQAIDKELLNSGGIFGFDVTSDTSDAQPEVSSKNYPYNSLVILRKYRIIPVSWELAALYIQKKRTVADCGGAGKNCTLQKLVDGFNLPESDFYQMVDPNWLLKVPPVRCMLEGYGPQVIQELEVDTNNDNLPDTTQIVRGKACVDYRTCLGQDARGECTRGYGYCLKEESIMHFTGKKCEKEFDSCLSFTDATARKPLAVLTHSLEDYKSGKCNEQNAGCRWYSNARQYEKDTNDNNYILGFQNKEKIKVESGIQREWSSAPAQHVFLSSSAKACQPNAAGCRQVSGPAGTPPYLRLPPDYLKCDQNGVTEDGVAEIQWYKRHECKEYTQLCKPEFEGCKKYLPLNDRIAVTGRVGEGGTCPAGCANIYSYTEGTSWFDENLSANTTVGRSPMWFNSGAPAQRCSIAQVGCEEFTNLETGDPGEQKEYFTYLQRCEKKDPDTIPANEVFYSFVGSDTAGGQPEKYFLVGEGTAGTDDWRPTCANSSKPCDCSAADAERQKYDPRIGAIRCREYINASGKPFYRYADNLIYRTSDCTSFRRTIEGPDALANTYSPSQSRRCAPAVANCREYRAPQAGNVHVIFYDNFEKQQVEGWSVPKRAQRSPELQLSISNESEILGDHSLKIKHTQNDIENNQTQSFRLDTPEGIVLIQDVSYEILFAVKSPIPVTVSSRISGQKQDDTFEDTAIGSRQITAQEVNTWVQVRGAGTVTQGYKNTAIYFEISGVPLGNEGKSYYLDDIIIKEVDGVEYLIRDTWQKNPACFNPTSDTPPAPNYQSPAYQGCSLYRDTKGVQYAIQNFERICPNEMAGCVKAQADHRSPSLFADFQDGSSALWNFQQGATLAIQSEGGNKFLRSSRSSTMSWAWNGIYTRVSPESFLRAHTTYNVTFDYRVSSPSGGDKIGMRGEGTAWSADPAGTTSHAIQNVPSWQQAEFTFTQPASDSTYLQFWHWHSAGHAAGATFDIDNVVIQPLSISIIPDQAKACQASENKCTAYGSPKLLTKYDTKDTPANSTDDVTSELPKIVNVEGVTQKEDWNIAYFKVTPQEARLAQAKFASGNTAGYGIGICSQQDLGCREYLSGSSKTYFRDPGARICQPPAPGKEGWTYRTCANAANAGIVCQKDSDCPVVGGISDTCSTAEKPCPIKNSTKTAPYERYAFALSCPAIANGCREIKDPNCKAGAGIETLKDNYGRTPGPTDSGIPCESSYYFTEDFDKRSRECSGVNPSAGCVLFDDAEKHRFEYQVCQKEDCSKTGGATDDNTYSTQQLGSGAVSYCFCDRNPLKEEECGEKIEAAPISPGDCYNRYEDIKKTGSERNRLRKYKKVRTDTQYDSCSLYKEARINGGATNITPSPTTTCTDAERSAYGPALDANTLIKVRPDRQCKVWLECSSYFFSGKDKICTQRTACKGGTPGEKCKDPIPNDDPLLQRLLRDTAYDASGKEARKQLLTYSGYARPDYGFINTTDPGRCNTTETTACKSSSECPTGESCIPNTITAGGYSADFHLWKSFSFVTNDSRLAYKRLVPSVPAGIASAIQASSQKVCTNDWRKPCNTSQDCPATKETGNIAGGCTAFGTSTPADLGYLNSCRLYPKQDSFNAKREKQIVDACKATTTASGGIYGFCLEPNPRFASNYGRSTPGPFAVSNTDPKTKKGYCSKSFNQPCDSDTDCPSARSEYCVRRYYEDYCLNWLPVDRTGLETLFTASDAASYQTSLPETLYYCLNESGWVKAPGFDQPVVIATLPEIRKVIHPADTDYQTRDSSGIYQADDCLDNTVMFFEDNPISGNQDEQCRRRLNFNEWNDEPGAENIIILQIGNESDLKPHRVGGLRKANDREKLIHRNDIQSITINDFGVFTFFFTTNPPSFTAERWFNSATEMTIAWNRDGDPYKDQKKIAGYSAFSGSSCAKTIDVGTGRDAGTGKNLINASLAYLTVRARFNSNDELDGWEIEHCGFEDQLYSKFNRFLSAVISLSITMDVTERTEIEYRAEDIAIQYDHNYCKEIIRVARDNTAILNQSNLLPDYKGTLEKDDYVNSSYYFNLARQGVCYTPNDPTRSLQSLSCSLHSACPYIKIAGCIPAAMSGPAHLPAWKYIDGNYNPRSGITIIGNLSDTRTKTPFQKIYEYWRWDERAKNGNGGYEKVGDIDGRGTDAAANKALQDFWGDTVREAKKNPPRIYDSNNARDAFDGATIDETDFELSFWVDVNESQLPIRYYNVQLPHRHEAITYSSQVDGRGVDDNYASSSGSRKEPMFGPFTHIYDPSVEKLVGLSNLEACVEVADNWGACTRTCGILGTDGQIGRFVTRADGTLNANANGCTFP